MQHNDHGQRKKERQVVCMRRRSYHDQRLQQWTSSASLLSRIRNFNHLALTSIGSFFSSPTITKTVVHIQQDEVKLSRGSPILHYGNELHTDVNPDSGSDPQGCISLPEDDDMTPVGKTFSSSQVVDYCNVKQLSSSRRFGMQDHLNLSDSNIFLLYSGAVIKKSLPLVQRDSSSHAHTLPCCPEARHLFGDLGCPDTMNGNTHISAEGSNLHNTGQHHDPLSFKSTVALEHATNTTLCAVAAVFVPTSPAARALLYRNESSMAPFETNVIELDMASVGAETPPLTPDSSKTGLLSPSSLSTSFELVVPSYTTCTPDYSDRIPDEFKVEYDDNHKILYTSPKLLEVKEGKKREQPSVRQTKHDTSPCPSLPGVIAAPTPDDPDGWYGLEYTLELSLRERQPLDTQSSSAGEHSKSRESWAAIHQGTIHPIFEDEDYYQWKNWHRFLDKQEERRKHKKGFAFKAYSKNLSCLFVDEMRTKDLLYWQKEVYGVVARETKERLNYITTHYPDPYFPPQKHDLAWHLKRSRSVACIRELKVIEDSTKVEEG